MATRPQCLKVMYIMEELFSFYCKSRIIFYIEFPTIIRVISKVENSFNCRSDGNSYQIKSSLDPPPQKAYVSNNGIVPNVSKTSKQSIARESKLLLCPIWILLRSLYKSWLEKTSQMTISIFFLSSTRSNMLVISSAIRKTTICFIFIKFLFSS